MVLNLFKEHVFSLRNSISFKNIDSFELWCWRRLLRVPWTARRSNKSILKKISPEYLSEGLILKLKLQYFGYLMRRTDSLEKKSDAGKDWRQEEKGMMEDEMVGWHHWFSGHQFEQILGASEGRGSLVCCSSWSSKELDMPQQLINNNNLFIWLCWVLVVGKKMATHSSILAWRIPRTEEAGRLQFMAS